jgi:hypothetical protein
MSKFCAYCGHNQESHGIRCCFGVFGSQNCSCKVFVDPETLPKQEQFNAEAVKNDRLKLRLDLVPILPLVEIAKVLTKGAEKYADRNWEKGFVYSRPYAASLRHLFSWWNGESIDYEFNISHLAHACCNLLFLLEFELRHTGTDDRPYKFEPSVSALFVGLEKSLQEAENNMRCYYCGSGYDESLADWQKVSHADTRETRETPAPVRYFHRICVKKLFNE